MSFRYVQIDTSDGYKVQEFYVKPGPGIAVGASVTAGQVIGTLQSLQGRYPGITDHIHIQIMSGGANVNPQSLIK